jgi:hypothetical protein
MAAVQYEDDAELSKLVTQLMKQHHQPLITNKVRIKAVLKVKMNDQDELVPSQSDRVKLSRVNALYASHVNADFVITVDAKWWKEGDARTRQPVLNFALCGIEVVGEEGKKKKLKTRRPDIIDYSMNVRLYGVYEQPLQNVLEFANGVSGVAADHIEAIVKRLKGDATPAKRSAPARAQSAPPPPPVAEADEETLPEEAQPQAAAKGGDEDYGFTPDPVERPAAGQEDTGEEAPPEPAAEGEEAPPEPAEEPEPPRTPPPSRRPPIAMPSRPKPPTLQR